VWGETKYDGERAQIHVQVAEDGSSRITIFSKSKRDSTLDRHAVHGIIRAALGLDSGTAPGKACKIKQNVILDAEMVAFRGEVVDGELFLHNFFPVSNDLFAEFWRIRQLIGDTAYGIRASNRWTSTAVDADELVFSSPLLSK
jgi:DNA ligase-4